MAAAPSGRAAAPAPGQRTDFVEVVEEFCDLLEASAHVLLHQSNCQTSHARGVAKSIYAAYPAADVYSVAERHGVREPGTTDFRSVRSAGAAGSAAGGSRKARGKAVGKSAGALGSARPLFVANLFGQDRPGKPGGKETAQTRERWFSLGLRDLEAKAMRELLRGEPSAGPAPSGSAGGPGAGLRRELCSAGAGERTLVVAVPKNIGCGLAGGSWDRYRKMLGDFAASLGGQLAQVAVSGRPRSSCPGATPVTVSGRGSRGRAGKPPRSSCPAATPGELEDASSTEAAADDGERKPETCGNPAAGDRPAVCDKPAVGGAAGHGEAERGEFPGIRLRLLICKFPMKCDGCQATPLEEKVDGRAGGGRSRFYCNACWEREW